MDTLRGLTERVTIIPHKRTKPVGLEIHGRFARVDGPRKENDGCGGSLGPRHTPIPVVVCDV